jgi:hypothetical protein
MLPQSVVLLQARNLRSISRSARNVGGGEFQQFHRLPVVAPIGPSGLLRLS